MALILEHMNISARILLDSLYDFHHEKQHSDKLSYAKSSMLLYCLKTYSLLIFNFFKKLRQGLTLWAGTHNVDQVGS